MRNVVIVDGLENVATHYSKCCHPVFGDEIIGLPVSYYDHRCDQSILTPLVFLYKKDDKAVVLPETSESQPEHSAILAGRWRQAKLPLVKYLKYRLYDLLH